MKKLLLSVTAIMLIAAIAHAQSVDDGIKFLYYERNTSAMQALQKAVAANPKDARGIYWLGRAYLANDDVAGAKTLYQKALNDGINDPWIWVGMGNVELLDGKGDVNAAKQNFEQAITATKGKKGNEDAEILNAIGRANADGSSLQGDPNYGIDVLKRALAIDLKNPDIDINLGICYLKLGGERGGDAVTAFQDALTRNPQYAKADFKIGKIYQSQDNKEFMTQWFDKAIAADPAYGPVYFGYFDYFEERDVNQAKTYLDKWLANSDQDCESSFFVADYAFRAGNSQESLSKAKAMEAGDCKNYPGLDILFALNYDKSGDSMQAKSYLDKFFATIPADKIRPQDYLFAGKLYGKIPGYQDTASGYFQKAVDADTIIRNKIVYANNAVNVMGNTGNLPLEMYWMGKLGTLRGGSIAESDYYKLGTTAQKTLMVADTAYMMQHDTVTIMKSYMLADSIDNAYINAFPAKPQGYSFRVIAAKIADYDSTKGLAVTPILQQNDYLSKDTSARARKGIFVNDYYLLIYYAQYEKDIPKVDAYKKAIDVASQMMALYPDPADENNQFAQKTKTQLEAAVNKYQQKSSSPPKSNK
jgi:tetratricopeptide (TPR) repeat protein